MLFTVAYKNKAIKAMCKNHIHYAWHDPEHFLTLLNVVRLGLHEHDHSDVKPYLTLAYFLMKNPGGERSENRLEAVMETFLESVSNNQQFYRLMEVFYEFIFKVVAALPHIMVWFGQHKEKWSFLAQWAINVSFPLPSPDGQAP